MCGFFGLVADSSPEENVANALKLIKHRGPDSQAYSVYPCDDATITLGHTRLAIIDLSEAGTQPFESQDGNLVIVFNGEIYNYLEIREELSGIGYEFITNSDTEVLLTAWQEWGTDALKKLIGMFSFAVLDRRISKVTLVRDAFGIKPLFYSFQNGCFIFSSDIRAVATLIDRPIEPDLQTAYDYLVHGDQDSSQRSFVDGILQLIPGSWIEYDIACGMLTGPETWWLPNIRSTSDLSFEEAAQKTRELFLESINYHLRSDVPVGVALSGGLDSSSVACSVRHLYPEIQIHTFSYISSAAESSEEKWVDDINFEVNAVAHKINASNKQLQEHLDSMILMQGEPFGGTSIYAQFRVFEVVNECGIKVTLDGQGADELLAGYDGYPGHRLLSLLESGKFYSAYKFSKEWSRWPNRNFMMAWLYLCRIIFPDSLYAFARKISGRNFSPPWIDSQYLRKKGVHLYERRYAIAKEYSGKRVREALMNSLQGRGLPGLLRQGDRNSMAFSVESRVPFLTLPLVEHLLSLPEEYLISMHGETKSVFREAMRGIVPDRHLDRRDKIGFETPESEWLLGMSDEITQWIRDAPDLTFLNKKEIQREFSKVVAGKRKFDGRVWRWINYLRWYTLVIGR